MLVLLCIVVASFFLAGLLLWAYERLNEQTEIDRWWAEAARRRAAEDSDER